MKRVILADFYPAALGGLVAVAAAIVLRTLIGTRLLAELVLDAMLGYLPGKSFSELLGVFGPYGKALFFASTLFGIFVFYVVVWMRLSRYTGRSRSDVTMLSAMAGMAVFGVLVAVSILLVVITDASLRSTSWAEYAFVTALTSALYAGVAGTQTLAAAPEHERLGIDAPPESSSRRQLLQLVPGVALGGLALFVIARTLKEAAGGGVQQSHRGERTNPVTPTDEFYVVSKNLIDPQVNGSSWRLNVGGMVDQRLELTYEEFLAFPPAEQYTTMQCISNYVGGELMSNALWRGVPLHNVLERAGVQSGGTYLLFRAADGYTVSLPLDFALREQVVLAYQMNGEQLTDKHGFPVRLLSPGVYGMMHPKWITDIMVINEEVLGYWQQQGWSQEARMNTSVRIDQPANRDTIAPAPYVVNGIAFSGDRGISKVEVSTDDGKTWEEATLKPPLGPYTWVLWEYTWTPPASSDKRIPIEARATDGDGVTQTADKSNPYPDGATGYHRVEVSIDSTSRDQSS